MDPLDGIRSRVKELELKVRAIIDLLELVPQYQEEKYTLVDPKKLGEEAE